MKLGICFLLLALVCLSEQISKIHNCPDSISQNPDYLNSCHLITCDEGRETPSILACPLVGCANGIAGYHRMDLSKLYPDCCDHPICQD